MSEENTTPAPGLTLPDDAVSASSVTAADRLLAFDATGDPVTATAEQVKEFANEGMATAEAMNAALAGKADKNGSTSTDFKASYYSCSDSKTMGVAVGNYSGSLNNNDVFLMNWDTELGAVALLSKEDPYFVRMGEWAKRTLYHSGNFNPAAKQDTTKNLAEGYDFNTLHMTGTYDTLNGVNSPVPGYIYVDVIKYTGGSNWVSQTVYTLGELNAPNRIFHRNGERNSDWTPWVELYHSGNLNPASAASVGLMSAEDKIKLNSVASAMSLDAEPLSTDETDASTGVSPEIQTRAQRSAQFQMQADELLYDALETFARNHPEYTEFGPWLSAKERIRQELPKPQEGGAE